MSGLSEERLAEIRVAIGRKRNRRYWTVDQCFAVDDLLAEVDRLRAEIAQRNEEVRLRRANVIPAGSWDDVCRQRDAARAENERLREELMRCGLLAVSERVDGCISKTTALRIRANVHRACWPDDSDSSGEESDG